MATMYVRDAIIAHMIGADMQTKISIYRQTWKM